MTSPKALIAVSLDCHSEAFSGSPVATKSHAYCIAEDGTVNVITISKEKTPIEKIELGEQSFATPAIQGNQMFLRTDTKLFAIGKQ